MDKDEIIETSQIVEVVEKPADPYRDARGVRIQTYRRFKEGIDYEALDKKDMVVLSDSILENVREHRRARKIGQPRKYETVDEFYDVVEQYIQYIIDANVDGVRLIPDVEGLASFMGISRDTLNRWENVDRLGEYSDAIKMVKNQFAYAKKQLALRGKIPPIVFATDFNNNHGYTQKIEQTTLAAAPLGSVSDPVELAKRIGGSVVDE